MKKLYIGVDLHKKQFTCYFMNEDSRGDFKRFGTDEKGISIFLQMLRILSEEGYEIFVGVESTGNTRYFKNCIEGLCNRVTIVNTMKFKVINESVNKTDKRDAKTIAEFLKKEMLPESNMCSEKSEQLKRLVKSRKVLVSTQVKLKNQIHGILLGYGIQTKSGQLNSKKGRQEVINQIRVKDVGSIVKVLVDSIENIIEDIKKIENKLDELTEDDDMVEILKSIPGTGKISAITVRAYLDDIKRFEHYKKFSSYCGLAPWVQISDDKKYYGSITKRGPEALRTAIVQMVLGMIRVKDERNNIFMRRYRNIREYKGSGKAIIAIARKMSKLIWTMLTNNEEYDPIKLNNEKIKRIAESMRKKSIKNVA